MKPEALIVAQPAYAQWEQLPLGAKAAKDLAEALTKHGYSLQHADLLDGGDKPKVEQALGEWFEKTSSDCVVLFWTGHGSSDGGHYLICRNSPRAGLTSFNAIDAQALGPVIASCKSEKILVILDTCYSGLGAGEIASAFSRVLANRLPIAGQERAIAVIASAHSLEKAQEGLFCNVLRSVLFEPAAIRPWSDEDECIHTELLARAVKKALPGDVSQPVYKADGIGQDFIPNPRFRGGRPAENVEERAWRLQHWAGSEHFDLAARGIEVGESGWFFAGRTQLLRRLVTWLENAPHEVRIVTGPPGAGKSAVMGRLATLSDRQYREAARRAGVMPSVDDGTIPPEGIIDVAIHAKGKTLDDCARALAEAFSLPVGKEVAVDIGALVTAVGRIERRLTIMIDALDEAVSGQSKNIVARLVVPLGRLERVRLLVGSRRSLDGRPVPWDEDRHDRLRAAFGREAKIDDLEDEFETQQDVAAYVRLRLGAGTSKHRGNEVGIRAAAERVAQRAQGTFLYARIVARTLQDSDWLDIELPTTALRAFEQDLRARFGAQEQRVNDLLAALAWGEGKGLTRGVWPSVATALTWPKRRYDDEDVSWVLGHAGWHIIETGEDGQAVYRLGHQALADHYRRWVRVTDAQVRIVAELSAGIAGAGWLECDRYLWRHLADHMKQARRFGPLLHDSGYLAVADPARLVTLLPGFDDDKVRFVGIYAGMGHRGFADIYNRVVDRLIGRLPMERLPLIHMTAQMEAPDLAPQLEPPVATRWRCRWAHVRRSTPHRILGRHSGPVTAIASGRLAGMVVSGGSDGTVRLWNLVSGGPIGQPFTGHTSRVTSIALGQIHDQDVVASGSDDCTIRLWDVQSGALIGQPLTGHTNSVTSVALGLVDGRAVVVSGSADHTIRLWDAESGAPIGQPVMASAGEHIAVMFDDIEGSPFEVSSTSDATIRLSDARSGAPIGEPLRGHTKEIRAFALGKVRDGVVLVSGSDDATVRLWDPFGGVLIGRPLVGHSAGVTSVAMGRVDRLDVVVSGSSDATIRLWDMESATPIDEPLIGHIGSVKTVAIGRMRNRTVILSGGSDGTIRLWETDSRVQIGQSVVGHARPVHAIALGEVDSHAIVVSANRDCTIQLWDAAGGAPIGEPLAGHTDQVNAVVLAEVDGRVMLVSGGDDIRVWDARSGTPTGHALKGHTSAVTSVALAGIDGHACVASGSWDGTVRMWDARSGAPIGKPLGCSRRVTAVALGEVDGHAVVVSGDEDGTIQLWDVRSGAHIGQPFKAHTQGLISIALREIDSRACILSGSWDGSIRLTVWDVRSGTPIDQLFRYTGSVRAVALGDLHGRAAVVWGTHDGTVRLWGESSGVITTINIGAESIALALDSDLGIVAGGEFGLLGIDVAGTD
jgi:WD40 repeat protein